MLKYTKNEHIKYAFNKNAKPIFDCELPVHIFGTGSEGNSVFFKNWNTLIDIGLPYNRYDAFDEDFFQYVDYVVVTHSHGDHLNASTLIKAMQNYPHIKCVMSKFTFEEITNPKFKAIYKTKKDENGKTLKEINPLGKEEIAYEYDDNYNKIIEKSPYKEKLEKLQHKFIIIDNESSNLKLTFPTRKGKIELTAFTVKHGDIVNIAIQIQDIDTGFLILYASDLDNLKGQTTFFDYNQKIQHVSGLPQNTMYDFILLEANYDEQIITDWMELHDSPSDLARARGNLRHISEKEAFDYVEKHLTNNGIFIPIHASKTFGTLIQQ